MHRGLQVPEIVWMVVSQLDSRSREDMAALAALAQCRIFHDPALDALWKEQNTIRNLINCMPDDLWQVQIINRMPTMPLRRPVRVEDWVRVLKYSDRIRSLTHESSELSEVFDVLRLNVPKDYLLPNLEKLHWRPATYNAQFSNIHLFLGPRITSLALPNLTWPELSFLPTLTRKFPHLSEVVLDASDLRRTDPRFTSAFSVFARGLQNARSLSFGEIAIDAGAIAHIGRLPAVETLHLAAPVGPSPHWTGLPQRGLFHSLRSVHLLCAEDAVIEFPVSLVQSWASLPLRLFQMTCREGMMAAATERLYGAMSEHCSHNSLETLDIKLFHHSDEPGDWAVPGRAVKLLFCFSNLTQVSITSTHGFQLDDETIAELAAAWPRIEELHLHGSAEERPTPQCGTLLALQALARHCSNLHTLELSFDATSIPPIPSKASARQLFLHPALVNLNVAHSQISHAFDVARFLSATFLNVTQLVTALEGDDIEDILEDDSDPIYAAQAVCHKLWKEAEAFLAGLYDIRLEEFTWGQQSIDQYVKTFLFLSSA
ncbi:hypothetical protein C8R45DRAFT_824394 [Mycena sanguinolenta]|nr:hypothetical protein C8R45DRAFT_824394 [Mycena sanguinolenta]